MLSPDERRHLAELEALPDSSLTPAQRAELARLRRAGLDSVARPLREGDRSALYTIVSREKNVPE